MPPSPLSRSPPLRKKSSWRGLMFAIVVVAVLFGLIVAWFGSAQRENQAAALRPVEQAKVAQVEATPKPNKPLPGQTTVPITGAFGWVLGRKIPPERVNEFRIVLDYQYGVLLDNDNVSTPPFKGVTVVGLKDGTIFEISADAASDEKQKVEAALEDKYGPGVLNRWYTGFVVSWTNADCVILEETWTNVDNYHISLRYRNETLYHQWIAARDASDKRAAGSLAPKL